MASVAETLVSCYHALASQLYQENKVEDAVATARKALASDYRQTKAAPKVAVYLLSILNYQYQTAADDTAEKKAAKAALLKDVTKTANGIVTLWGAKEEGDAARIVLMRIAQAQDNGQEADRNLNEINPRSNEYATALTAMGYWHWSKYRTATRQTPDGAGNKTASRDEDRRLAVDFTERAVKALEDKDKLRSETAAMPDDLRECKFLLAGIYTEGKDYKQAVSQYKPLLADMLNKDSKRKLDETGLLILQGAGQVFIQLSDVENLTVIGNGLLERGPDQPQVNRAIMGFATGLDKLRKAAPESDSSDSAAQQEAAAAKLKSLTDLEEKIMINLSKREKLAPNDMTWIAITCANLGTDDARLAAAELIKQIDKKANSDKAFFGQVEKSLPYLHSLAARILAEIGQFDQAQEMIDRLIQAYPKVLEPKISEAQILTAWASRDPSKYEKAILAWDSLRTKLEHNSPKPVAGAPIDPKYEVIVNEADCFLKDGAEDQEQGRRQEGHGSAHALSESRSEHSQPQRRIPGDQHQVLSRRRKSRRIPRRLAAGPPEGQADACCLLIRDLIRLRRRPTARRFRPNDRERTGSWKPSPASSRRRRDRHWPWDASWKCRTSVAIPSVACAAGNARWRPGEPPPPGPFPAAGIAHAPGLAGHGVVAWRCHRRGRCHGRQDADVARRRCHRFDRRRRDHSASASRKWLCHRHCRHAYPNANRDRESCHALSPTTSWSMNRFGRLTLVGLGRVFGM